MKLKKSVEQGVSILIMLATQQNHTPLKSYTISTYLGVSDSYLKKIMRNLVVYNLVTSEAGKEGGFVLKRNADFISMLDIYHAIEGEESLVQNDQLGMKVLLMEGENVPHGTKIMNLFEEAENSFLSKLNEYKLSQLLKGVDFKNGYIDWESKVNSE